MRFQCEGINIFIGEFLTPAAGKLSFRSFYFLIGKKIGHRFKWSGRSDMHLCHGIRT